MLGVRVGVDYRLIRQVHTLNGEICFPVEEAHLTQARLMLEDRDAKILKLQAFAYKCFTSVEPMHVGSLTPAARELGVIE